MTIYVQFSDSTQTTIVATFGAPQDEKAYPNQGTVTPSDARWAQFYASLSQSAQQALTAPTNPVAGPQQPAIRTQLAALDMDIPRGLEDFWTTSNFAVATLPAATQVKLANKVALRTQLAGLIAAKTP